MDIETLTKFFMWCTLINGGILVLWGMLCLFALDVGYRIQSAFFPVSRETFNIAIYAFMGAFKICFMLFNLVPYLALLIVS